MINFADEEESLAFETYQTWARMFELQRYYSWIIDRFHISTRAYQLKHRSRDYQFAWLEQRLLPLGFHMIFVTQTLGSFKSACEERLKVSGNPAHYDDLAIFTEEQELMKSLIEDSILPTYQLDVSDNDVLGASDKIADYLEQVGVLWMD